MSLVKVGERKFIIEPTNFGKPYQELFDQTELSINEQYRAASHNNFNNAFAEANQGLYDRMGWWGVISRDKVLTSGATNDKGQLKLAYVSHADTDWEKTHNVWAPKNGWYVPTKDGIFVPETGVPFETVQDRNEAVSRFEKAGLPKEWVSYFYRLDNYKNDERFVGHSFLPLLGGYGRFVVVALRLPSYGGDDRVASFPAYREQEVVLEVPMVESAKA